MLSAQAGKKNQGMHSDQVCLSRVIEFHVCLKITFPMEIHSLPHRHMNTLATDHTLFIPAQLFSSAFLLYVMVFCLHMYLCKGVNSHGTGLQMVELPCGC